ncbi:uncharacterized protein RSE6_10863 [Rhynchosporium secalis]|uniref:Uncharacterized protein n=1 Tax=Rhynchosporium secalis TaxID=38038 RepID=A0A1E1MLJ1_RHYSE|nr:uncharacterized protein RSE6_10863 [Rhynchosporium secalis]
MVTAADVGNYYPHAAANHTWSSQSTPEGYPSDQEYCKFPLRIAELKKGRHGRASICAGCVASSSYPQKERGRYASNCQVRRVIKFGQSTEQDTRGLNCEVLDEVSIMREDMRSVAMQITIMFLFLSL